MGADGLAALRWSPNTEDDLAGYRIYRAQLPDSVRSLVRDAAVAELDPDAPTVTVDDFATDGTWYFTVTAYDVSNNESGQAGPVSKTIVRPAVRLGRTVM